jgi:putative N6-adenine-specific DNA methylase
MSKTFEMVAKTLYGLEEILAGELLTLGANDIQLGRRMVSFTGDKELLYKANFCCRTALRILKPIQKFKAKDADTVYNEVKKIQWEDFISLDKTFAIDSVINSEDFNHSKFVAYRTKDAIADYFFEKYGKRPSVRVNNPDLLINIHISHNDVTVSIDSSGESLHKRGYRVDQTEAPLNEVLAAGMILKTGWKGDSNFVDPMCGSGTLLIEAAMIALNIAPGIHRKEFAFEKWVDFDQEMFDNIYNDESNEREFKFKCYGSDISPIAIDIARENIRNAGLMKYIDLKVLPFQQYNEAPQPGILVTNPPYGERISSKDLLGLYNMIGERLKHVFTGYSAWILSYKDECFDKIGLRPSEKMKMLNGSLECEYRCYEMFEGTNKEYKKALNEEGKEEKKEERKPSDRRPTSYKPGMKGKMDRPERRFSAAHSEDDSDDDFQGGRAKFQRKREFKDDSMGKERRGGFDKRRDRNGFDKKRGGFDRDRKGFNKEDRRDFGRPRKEFDKKKSFKRRERNDFDD